MGMDVPGEVEVVSITIPHRPCPASFKYSLLWFQNWSPLLRRAEPTESANDEAGSEWPFEELTLIDWIGPRWLLQALASTESVSLPISLSPAST